MRTIREQHVSDGMSAYHNLGRYPSATKVNPGWLNGMPLVEEKVIPSLVSFRLIR